MSLIHFYSPQAEKDLNEIAQYILEDNLKAALRFVDDVEKACADLVRMPDMGRIFDMTNPLLENIRIIRVSKVYPNYFIFYRQVKKRIEAVRILHGARDLPVLFDK
jgi:toxin ParE1/3/4